jgi:ArpU family phage transcriptional regulator
MQGILFEMDTLTKEKRRGVERLLFQYKSMSSIIRAMEKDIPSPKMTPSYDLKEGTGGINTSSEVEKIILAKEKVEEKRRIKEKLEILRQGMNEKQQRIWDYRYDRGWYDDAVIAEIDTSHRQYHREKTNLIRQVAEAFYLL